MSGIAIYQITHSDLVAHKKDADFRVFDCRHDPAPEKREIYHMRTFYNSGGHEKSRLSGLVSPLFNQKTKLSGRQFISFIEANPGFDVYFINPYPQMAYLAFNVWEQGEFFHPGLCELANKALRAAGHPLDVRTVTRNSADTLLYCNYWVGSVHFWNEYMSFVGSLMQAIEEMTAEDRSRFFSKPNATTRSPYYPYIFERTFSTFLLQRPDIKALAYPFPRAENARYCRNEFEALLVDEWADMIDAWDRERPYDEGRRRFFSPLLKAVELHERVTKRKIKWRRLLGRN